MASTNKTPRLGLNSWAATDAPMRADFNQDNTLIDQALGEHRADSSLHLSAADRTLLTGAFVTGSYVGNAQATRAFNIGFRPKFGVVFAAGTFLCEYSGDMRYTACALGFVTPLGDSVGVHSASNGFSVDYHEGNAAAKTMPVFNRQDVRYVYAMWR